MGELDCRPVAVIGAGGHAKVVISTLLAAGFEVACVYDDDSSKWGSEVLGAPVRGPVAEIESNPRLKAIIAVGDNGAREKMAGRFEQIEWLAVVHPAAYVHPSVKIAEGTVVFAGAVIQPDAVIGAHAIINTGATVDHDCAIGDFVHVAPGTNLAGGVRVGRGAFLGIGSAVIPYRSIGEWTTVGAGGVVIDDLPARITAVGVPARQINPKERR
jgi:sugar O-acyltransferase (sialic acid O-acetyltransferase NeuD family)